MDRSFNVINDLEIEPLSDELLESVAGAGLSDGCVSSTGPVCCSCVDCSHMSPQQKLAAAAAGTQ